MSFDYKIYGLQITSSRKLSLLPEKINTGCDLSIIWTSDENDTPYTGLNWERVMTNGLKYRGGLFVYTAETEQGVVYKLWYQMLNDVYYLSPDTKTLWAVHSKNAREVDMDSTFTGPALGAILRLKGFICLHASVVNIDGVGVAFSGKKTAGKSTMAAAFAKMGYNVVADDVTVIKLNNGKYYIEPGYPKVRLRPLALAAIHPGDAENYQQVYSNLDTRFSDIENNFHEETLPLGVIYMLNPAENIGDKPVFEPVTAAGKLIKLSENSFGSYILTKELRKQEFMFFGQLAAEIPIRTMSVEHNLDNLEIQCLSVIEDFRRVKETGG